jgi:hypothetical protein
MDASEMDALVQRLVKNPHDHDALAHAHSAGNSDPKSYAVFLEKVGNETPDPAYASHWLSEAANVWSITLGDAHRAAKVLMMAVDKDPTQETAAERLAQLYRDKGEHKALVALLERRAKALAPLAQHTTELRLPLAGIHEELGRLWSEPPLSVQKKGVENYRRAIELDAASAYAIYALRELHKQNEQWNEAVPLFQMEQAIIDDPQRKVALYRDEAQVRKAAGDRLGATEVLRQARAFAAEDPALAQELGASILERMQAGDDVPQQERDESAELFVSLAEMYDGEHGFAYSTAALDVTPGNDRAMQLAAHYGDALGRTAELPPRWAEYLKANPSGPLAAEARTHAGEAPAIVAAVPAVAGAEPKEAAGPSFSAAAPAMVDGAGRGDQVPRLLEAAVALAAKGQKPQALAKYREVLAIDPASPEALAWVEDYLRQKRQYAELRDVLMQAVRSPSATHETKKQQLLEVAGLCETQLRDIETAILAYKQICQIDRADVGARDNLRRLLERGGRWDDLAATIEQEAMATSDVEAKIMLEKKLAQLHEVKRKDPVAAGEVWARIATLLSGDEAPIHTAIKLFEKGKRGDLAAQVIADNAGAIEDKAGKSALYQRLGDLREKNGETGDAGEAYALAAEAEPNLKTWEAAERLFVAAERWERAAYAVGQQAEITSEPRAKAALLARAGGQLTKAGDYANALLYMEGASALDPAEETYAAEIESKYTQAERFGDLAELLLGRAEKLDDARKRIALRKRAADVQTGKLNDPAAARESLLKALEDGDDLDVLSRLSNDAEQRGDAAQAREFLHRLVGIAEPADKLRFALREGDLLGETLGDPDAAIDRYTWILDKLDPKNREAVQKIAALEEKRGNQAGVAEALERALVMASDDAEKLEIAHKLAPLYEGPLDEPKKAIAVLNLVHKLDEEDFEATAHLETLSEKTEDWPRVAELLSALIEVEGDEQELSVLSRKLADVLSTKLDRGDDALAALMVQGDAGDQACRDAYVELGDKLGWKGIVATKLVEWYGEAAPTPARNGALRGAFERFIGVGRDAEAAKVAVELARSRGTDLEMARKLEEIAAALKDLEALSVAHDLIAKELSGPERAAELVRQAEVLVAAGVDPVEAQQHGEAGLISVPPAQVESLLARLAALTQAPGPIIDVYERQIGRCKVPADRLTALSRAAQIAATHDAPDRARSFYELALSAGAQEETLLALELSATHGDREHGGTTLRRMLAEALSGGGQASRDGGRTRGILLRRAARIAFRELADVDKAFGWLGDALIAHVEAASLDALEELALEVDDLGRAEATLGRALTEVFDGPLVRQLLARRIKLRKEKLGNPAGAAEDLKKLHDLSPGDVGVMDELSELLTQLGDFRGMVHVLEDQILRGKDPQARTELARKVARLWEEQLKDPREAADAWRRVLRMKPGDPDAQAGLERAKADMLKQKAQQRAPVEDEEEEVEEAPAAPPVAAVKSAPVDAVEPQQPEAASDLEPPPASAPEESAAEAAAKTPVPAGDEAPADANGVAHEAVAEAAESEPAPVESEPAKADATEAADGEAAPSADEEEIISVDDAELVDEGELVDEPEKPSDK